MTSLKLLMAAPLLIGTAACGTIPLPRVNPAPPQPPPLVLPAECSLEPTEPVPVTPPTLPTLPDARASTYWPLRAQRAELAGLSLQAQRDAERDARVTNAQAQHVCADWARSHQ